MKINEMTPRQFAHDLAAGWLASAYRGGTGDLDDLTPAQKREVKAQIAKLHNRLVEQANLDSSPLDETTGLRFPW